MSETSWWATREAQDSRETFWRLARVESERMNAVTRVPVYLGSYEAEQTKKAARRAKELI